MQSSAPQQGGGRKNSSRFKKDRHTHRSSMFGQSVLKEGYLEKESSGMLKKWQRRYFELSGHYLKYYETKEAQAQVQTSGDSGEKTIKGTVDARDFGEVSTQGAVITVTLKKSEGESDGKRSKGRLSASGGHSTAIRLRAPSESRWLLFGSSRSKQ